MIAQWLDRVWEVTTSKVFAIDGLTTSYKLKADTNNDTEGQASTNSRAMELQPLSFACVLSDTVGLDVRAELEAWEALVGQYGPFLLGGRRFGPEKVQLQEVGVSEAVLDDRGRMRYAKLALKFQEYANEPTGGKTKSKLSVTAAAGSGAYDELGITASAAGLGASTQDKAAMKGTNTQLG